MDPVSITVGFAIATGVAYLKGWGPFATDPTTAPVDPMPSAAAPAVSAAAAPAVPAAAPAVPAMVQTKPKSLVPAAAPAVPAAAPAVPAMVQTKPKSAAVNAPMLPTVSKKSVVQFEMIDPADPDLENILEQTLRMQMTHDMTEIMDKYHKANPTSYKFIIAGGRAFEYMISPALQNILESKTINVGGEEKSMYSKSFDYDVYVYPPVGEMASFEYNPVYYNAAGYTYNKGVYSNGYSIKNPGEFPPFQTLLNGLNNFYKTNVADPLPAIFRKNIYECLMFIDSTNSFIDFNKLMSNLSRGTAFQGRFTEIRRKPMWSIDFRIPLLKVVGGKDYIDLSLVDLKNVVREVVRTPSGTPIRFKKNDAKSYVQDSNGLYYKLLAPAETYITIRTFPNIRGRFSWDSCVIKVTNSSIHDIANIRGKDKHIYAFHPFIMTDDNGWLVGSSDTGRELFEGWPEYKGGFNNVFKSILSVFGIEKTFDLPFVIDPVEEENYKRNLLKYKNKYIKRLIRCVSILILCMHLTDNPYRLPLLLMDFHKLYLYFNINFLPFATFERHYNRIQGCVSFPTGNVFKFMFEGFNKNLIEGVLAHTAIDQTSTKTYPMCVSGSKNYNLNTWGNWKRIGNAYLNNMSYYNYWNLDPRIVAPDGPIEIKDTNAFTMPGSSITYIDVAKKWTNPGDGRNVFWKGGRFDHLWQVSNYLYDTIKGSTGFSRRDFMRTINAQVSTDTIANYLYHLYWYSYNIDQFKINASYTKTLFAPKREFIAWRFTFPQYFFLRDNYNNFKRGLLEQAPVGSIVYPMNCLSATMKAYDETQPAWSSLPGPVNALTQGYSLYKIKTTGKGCLFINKTSFFPEQELLVLPWSAFRIISRKWKYLQHIDQTQPENLNQYRRIYVIELEQIEESYDDLFKSFPSKSFPAAASGKSTTVALGKPTTPVLGKPTTVALGKPKTTVSGKPTTTVSGKLTTAVAASPVAVLGKGAAKSAPAAKPLTLPSAAAVPLAAPVAVCPPPDADVIGTSIGAINTFVNNNTVPEERGENDRLVFEGTIFGSAGGRNKFGLPNNLMKKPVIRTEGDGTCGVHAFLLATSSVYRKLKDNATRSRVGIEFRKNVMFSAAPAHISKTDACNQHYWLFNNQVRLLAKRFGLNALIIGHLCSPSESGTPKLYIHPVIQQLDPDETFEEGAPFIVIENKAGKHFRIVLAGTNLESGTNATLENFTISYDQGMDFYERFNATAVVAAVASTASNIKDYCTHVDWAMAHPSVVVYSHPKPSPPITASTPVIDSWSSTTFDKVVEFVIKGLEGGTVPSITQVPEFKTLIDDWANQGNIMTTWAKPQLTVISEKPITLFVPIEIQSDVNNYRENLRKAIFDLPTDFNNGAEILRQLIENILRFDQEAIFNNLKQLASGYKTISDFSILMRDIINVGQEYPFKDGRTFPTVTILMFVGDNNHITKTSGYFKTFLQFTPGLRLNSDEFMTYWAEFCFFEEYTNAVFILLIERFAQGLYNYVAQLKKQDKTIDSVFFKYDGLYIGTKATEWKYTHFEQFQNAIKRCGVAFNKANETLEKFGADFDKNLPSKLGGSWSLRKTIRRKKDSRRYKTRARKNLRKRKQNSFLKLKFSA